MLNLTETPLPPSTHSSLRCPAKFKGTTLGHHEIPRLDTGMPRQVTRARVVRLREAMVICVAPRHETVNAGFPDRFSGEIEVICPDVM